MRSLKLTVPPKASASLSAVTVLNTSIPSSMSEEMILRSVLLSPDSELDRRIPSIVIALYFGATPRITTFVPSPPTLLIETPGNLPTDSAALASGSVCIRADETAFIMDFDDNC